MEVIMILNDREIRSRIEAGMIEGAEMSQVRSGVISYGVTSFGYDMRVAPEWQIFRGDKARVIDPKKKNLHELLDSITADSIKIPAGEFVLCRSMEYFRIPRNVLAVVLGKSTYARCGLIVNCTPLEPEWEGHVTIELSNTAPLPIRVYANEGIAQVLFFEGSHPDTSYADKGGKYQKQVGITLPKVE
jgi:dCTP deaminase